MLGKHYVELNTVNKKGSKDRGGDRLLIFNTDIADTKITDTRIKDTALKNESKLVSVPV